MNLTKPLVAAVALAATLVAVGQELGIPDSIEREQKRLSRFLPGSTKERSDDVGEDLARDLRNGRVNDRNILGELSQRVNNMPGRSRTTTENEVASARALSATLRLQDREIREVAKSREEVNRLRQWLQREQREITARARQLNIALRDVKVDEVDKPRGWPLNEPIHVARAGVPVVAWSKEELAQTYRNHSEQLDAIAQGPGRSERLDALYARRGRIIDALGGLLSRTSRLSDEALRQVKF
jgi:hypothetical protein